MKAKNKLLLLAMYVAVLIGFASIDSLAATSNGTGGGNWNNPATWVGNTLPTSGEDVIIAANDVVVVNLDLTDANGNRSIGSLTINNGATLRPDAGVRNIEIDNDLTVTGTGIAQYNYLTTGRLNWTFTGVTDGIASISSAVQANTQFHNLTFAGAGVNASSGGATGFTVYGDMTVSSLSSLDMNDDEVLFNNTTAKSITNNNTITWASIELAEDAVVNYNGASGSDNNVEGNFDIGTDATLNIVAPTVIDLTTGATTTITNDGNLNFASGTELNCETTHNIDLSSSNGDINNFNGDLTFTGTCTFTLGARSINGTGTITTSSATTISLANATGVKGAINLTGTRTFTAGNSFIFSGAGDTGFNYTSGNDVTSVGNLTISGATTSADDFTITGNFTGGSAFTASAGTITMGGATTTISGAGAKTFNNLTVTSTATSTLSQNITVAGSLIQTGAGQIITGANTIAMTGTGTLTVINGDFTGPGAITVSGASSNVTLGDDLDLGSVGTITMNNATAILDLADNAITSTASPATVITLTAGTIRSSATTGLVANFTGLGATELSVASGVNFEFYGSSITSLGFAVGGVAVAGTGGTSGTGIDLINDLTIENTTTTINAVGQTIGLLGDLTVETGANMTLAANSLDFRASTAQEIINNGSLVLFNSTIGATGDASITTASSFTIAGTMTMNDADDDFTSTLGTITFTNAGAGIAYTVNAVANPITFNNVIVTGAGNTWGATNFASSSNIVINGDLTVSTLTVDPAQGVTLAGFGKTITVNTALSLGDVVVSGTYTTDDNITVTGDTFTNTGAFTATAGLVTFDTGTVDELTLANTTGGSPIDSLVFYNVSFDGTNGAQATAIFTVTNNFTNSDATSTFDGTGGTIKFNGTPSTIIANATNTSTVFGNINIPTNKKVTMTAGDFVTLAGTLTLTGTLEVNDDAQITGTGNIVSASGSELIYNSTAGTGGFAAAITANGAHVWDNNMNLTVGAAATGVTDLGLDVPGTEITQCGNLTLNESGTVTTTSSTASLTVNGNVVVAAGVTFALANATDDIILAGTSKTFQNLSNAFQLFDVLVTGSYTETASSLGFNTAGVDATLNISGTWNSTLATGSTITINGTATSVEPIQGTGSKTFNNLTFGAAITAATPIDVSYTVNGNLSLTNVGAVSHTDGSTVTLAGTSKTITNDITTNTRADLTFGHLNVTGSYTLSDGTVNAGFEIITDGSLTVGSTGTLSVHSGTVTAIGTTQGVSFAGDGYITGTGSITLGALSVAAGAVEILTGTTVTVNGGIAGALTVGAGSLTSFGSSNLILANGAGTNNIALAAGSISLANLEIAASAVVTNNESLTIKDNIVVGSGASFVSSAGTITLDSAGTSTITNSGTLTFYDLTIAATANNVITTSSDFNVANTMLMGAVATNSFTATNGTVTFNGGAQALTNNSTNSAGLTFYNLAKTGTGALTYTPDANIYIKGDITAAGTGTMNFQAITATNRMYLNGTAEQNIVIGTTAVNAIDFGFITINNQFGVKVSGATTEGDIQVYKTLRLQNGDLDLNGNNIIEIIQAAGLLSETAGNTIINSGTAASVGYVFVSRTSTTFTNDNMNGIGVNMTTGTASSMKIKRYSISRNVGSVDGISRVFSIVSSTTTGLDAKAVFRYDDSELNGLTAADLKMTRTDDQITGPWYLETSTVNTTNKIITVDDIDGFTSGSEYEYWTATAPVTVTTAELTKGLVDNPLVAGRTEQAIYGLEFSANGDVDVNEITFGLDRDVTIANEFSKYYLVKSGDNDYATEDDNEVLISGTNGVPATLTVATAGVTFDVSALDEMVTAGTKLNYFLVVDVATNVTTATSAIGATFNETNLDITNGIAEAVSENGTDYTFKPGLMIDQISNGLTQSPLIAGTTNNGLIGFQITSTSNATDGFDTLFVGTNVDVTDIFSAVRLVRSTTNDVTTGTLTTVKTGTISEDGIAFNNLNEASTTTAKFYFLVGDVKSGVDQNTASVVFTIEDADLNDDANAGPRYINAIGNVSSSFSSPSYSFAKSEVTISETTPLVSQSTNLGRGVNNQPVFRFTLASDNGNPVSFTKVVAHATLAKGLTAANVTAWRLWYDANGNDYPDTGEQISTGAYSASATQGNLTFDNFTAAQTTSSSRKYIVTVNLAVGTTVNSELSVSLLSQSYVTVTSPAKVNPFTEIEGDTYTVKAPGTASTAKIVGLSTNSVISGGNVSFTVRVFDASDVPANLTSSASVALNVAGGGFTFGGTTTGTILAGGNFVSITPTMSHATGTTTATVTASVTGIPSFTTTAATQNITVFKSAPTTNGTVTISTVTTTTMQLSGWTAGTGGSGRIVVISATTPPTAPTNGVTYTANTNIGSGGATAQTGPGSFVVAMGASAVTTISGLTPGVTYYVQVFEYDGSGSTIIYNTSSKTSVAVDNAGTITGNPAFKATTAGSIGGASLAAAVNISTDVDVTASITSETEAENGKWFKFKVNSNRNNFYIKISDLPANYSLYLYDNTTGNELLFRTSEALSTTNDAVIVNNATAGEYLIKVFGADNEQYDASTFGLRVVTSASEVMSLEE